MRVLAVKPAFHNGNRVREGQVVEWKGDKPPSWGEEYTGQSLEQEEASNGPDTLSGLAALEDNRKKLKVARTKLTKARNAFEDDPNVEGAAEAVDDAEKEVADLEALVEADGH